MSQPTESIRYRVLRWLATLVCRLAWPIVILSVLLAAASMYYAFGCKKLGFTGNPNDLLRSDASFHQRYLEYTRDFRAEEDYSVVVQGPGFDRNKECVEWLAAEMRKQPALFKNVFYHIDLNGLAKDRGLLFLEVNQLQAIEKGLGDFTSLMGKDTFTLDLNSLLDVASKQFDEKNLRNNKNNQAVDDFAKEFVKSLDALADRLEGKNKTKPVRFGDFLAKNAQLGDMETQQAQHEYLSLEDGKILILQVPSPNKEAEMGGHDYIIQPLKKIIDEARIKFPRLDIGLTGEPALSEDQDKAVTHDSTLSSIVTFALIALLFLYSFHEFSRPALALLTLVIAVCWTIGFTTIAVGRLNILSMAFIPMILGLGIDFGIQILGRYEEELPRGGDVIGALTNTIMHTGNAIITGASTTAFAFYTMCFNQFTGLAEMGKIGGTGIFLCVLANLVLLPALLAIRDRKSSRQAVPTSQHYDTEKIFILDRVILDHAWTIIVASALITALAIYQLPKISFDYNLLTLQNPNLESVRFERKLIDSKDSRSVIFAVSLCDSLKEAADKAAKFKKLNTVVYDAMSITEMVPRDQEPKLKIITSIKHKLESVQVPKSGVKVNVAENLRVLQGLRANCARMLKLAETWAAKEQREEAKEFFGKLISAMDRSIRLLQPMSQAKAEEILTAYQTSLLGEMRKNLQWLKSQKVDRAITVDDIPEVLRNRYIRKGADGKIRRVLIEIYPREDVWDRDPLARFVQKIRSVDANVTGTPVQNYEYIELLRQSYETAAYYALAVIFLLITFHFRTFKYVFPTLLPLALGMIWSAGTMPLVGVNFNPANIICLPLIIGIGVAYGVYAVDRYRENRSPALFSTSTGKAIVLSALTTIFGFGSLAFASDPSLASLGLLMTIGVTMCLITSLYVCPAILHVLGRRKIEVKE